MRRIFGGKQKPEAPKPTLAEATDSAGKRDQVLAGKIKELDKQLAEFKVQLKTTRAGPAQNRIKQRAMQVLKQKRMYENQQDQVQMTSLFILLR
jgi:charged multivesicular body protein 5